MISRVYFMSLIINSHRCNMRKLDKSAYLTDYKAISKANFDFCETALSQDELSHSHYAAVRVLKRQTEYIRSCCDACETKKFQIFKRDFLFC